MRTPYKMKYSPVKGKLSDFFKGVFSKKKKSKAPKVEETSTEHLNRQVKEKDDYYSKQKGTSLKR